MSKFRIDDPYEILTKDLLEEEYVTNGLTDRQIADKYSVGSKATVWRRRKFYGIANFQPNKSNKNASKNRSVFIPIEQALAMKEEGLTHQQMADRIGCSRMSVCRRLKEIGLVEETPQAQHKLRWHEDLTDVQIRFLLGTLLGDGNITPSGMFQCNHSRKQREYVEHKFKTLFSLMSPNERVSDREVTLKKSGKTHQTCFIRSMANKHVKRMYEEFYPNGTKIFPPEYLRRSQFGSDSLAYWYMDDGSLSGKACYLHTFGFGYSGSYEAAAFLYDRFGIVSEVKRLSGRPEEKAYRLFLPTCHASKFFTIVQPHILPCMLRKLPEDFRSVG